MYVQELQNTNGTIFNILFSFGDKNFLEYIVHVFHGQDLDKIQYVFIWTSIFKSFKFYIILFYLFLILINF